jgi:NADH:ubiquinone oxidoreductase subunit K
MHVSITLTHYLVLSAILFAIGVYGVLTRRNAIALLMGVELMQRRQHQLGGDEPLFAT